MLLNPDHGAQIYIMLHISSHILHIFTLFSVMSLRVCELVKSNTINTRLCSHVCSSGNEWGTGSFLVWDCGGLRYNFQSWSWSLFSGLHRGLQFATCSVSATFL